MTITPLFLHWRRGYWFLIGTTALAVALADVLFYRRPLGWTAGLFATALVTLLTLRGAAFLGSFAGRVVAIATVGIIVALVEEPAPLTLAVAVACLAALAALNRGAVPASVGQWLRRLGDVLVLAPLRLLADNRIAARSLRRRPLAVAGPLGLVVVWVGPLLLGGVFVALFSAANPIISRWAAEAARAAWDAIISVASLFDLGRNAFWLVTAACVYGLLRVRRRRGKGPTSDAVASAGAGAAAGARPEWDWTLDLGGPPRRVATTTGVVVRCLVVCNLVFAVQTALDVVYLLGGAALPDGMGYAEYAHRGAYPLVAAAVLCGLFVLATFRPGAAAERSAVARRLVYLWVAQSVLLTATAAWRLDLYVGVYSLTRLRLAAGIWMALVAAGLVWAVCRIVLARSNAWLVNANVLTAAAVLYACCFPNVDGFIADFNVRHCREAGVPGAAPLDVAYLHRLGPDALPALRTVQPKLTGPRAEAAGRYAAALERELSGQLSDWRGWTFRRGRLASTAGTKNAEALRSAAKPPPSRLRRRGQG